MIVKTPKSLFCYKHVVATVFVVAKKRAFACPDK